MRYEMIAAGGDGRTVLIRCKHVIADGERFQMRNIVLLYRRNVVVVLVVNACQLRAPIAATFDLLMLQMPIDFTDFQQLTEQQAKRWSGLFFKRPAALPQTITV